MTRTTPAINAARSRAIAKITNAIGLGFVINHPNARDGHAITTLVPTITSEHISRAHWPTAAGALIEASAQASTQSVATPLDAWISGIDFSALKGEAIVVEDQVVRGQEDFWNAVADAVDAATAAGRKLVEIRVHQAMVGG